MDGIKIEVTGNIARVTDRPARLTSGMVGLPVEFTFDSHWDGLSKTAVFRAGKTELIAEGLETETTVPWEALDKPNVWLSIGVYGASADGTIVIPTIWANVCLICEGVNPDGDVSTAPTLPVWQRLLNAVGNLLGLTTNAKDNLVEAINEVHNIALAGGIESDPTLSQSGKAADAKVTGDVIQTHANDQKNPHKVTAEQIGARPNTWMPTAEDVGARPNTWTPSVSEVGAAPSGYGLGEGGTYPNDVGLTGPNLARGGFFRWDSLGQSNGYPFVYGTMLVVPRAKDSSSFMLAYCHADSYKGTIAVKQYVSGAETKWEYINPPMALGVEYLTTKRFEGKPVYMKAFNTGNLPTNTSATIAHGINNVDKTISVRGYITGQGASVTIPYYDSTTNWIGVTFQRNNYTIATGHNASAFTAVLFVEYTKTTD